MMQLRWTLALLSMAALLCTGASVILGGEDMGDGVNPTEEAGERAQIVAAIRKFVDAYNRADLQGLMSCYAEDLVKLRQGAGPETKTETGLRVERVLRENRAELSVSNEEIEVSGDVAYARGSLELTLTPRTGGPSQVVRRRFIEIWHRRNGVWLVARTMDNAPPGER
jgi:ketosteroid isomerase-like protein